MKLLLSALGILALGTAAAQAGGIDRSGQGIGAIFEKGNHAELSFGQVTPSVSGVMLGIPLNSGNMASSYSQVGFAAKADVNEKVSVAVIVDQPFGASVSYEAAGYPLNTTNAIVATTSITLLGRYKFNDKFSLHGGLRQVAVHGHYDPVGPYASVYSTGSDVGYVIGGAFEKPEIALRVALTYSSGTKFNLDGTLGDIVAEMPQSLNLDFQTGIAADTLLFGSIRWADWTEGYITDTMAGVLADYTSDVTTYSIGVGRKFNDNWSGAVTLGYEEAEGTLASNLSPTDGFTSIGLGATYTRNTMKITAGVRYLDLGNATTESAGAFPGAKFSDNSAVAVGLKVAFAF